MNTAYCCLILLGKLIQRVVFGQLRVSEQQHVKDKFWNFVFYKFIFVFGVINVQYLDEVVLWVAWFSVLGFLHLLAQLCKDRFEYVSIFCKNFFQSFKIILVSVKPYSVVCSSCHSRQQLLDGVMHDLSVCCLPSYFYLDSCFLFALLLASLMDLILLHSWLLRYV